MKMDRISAAQREAIARLFAIALDDTGQSRRVAEFLLAWHNAAENGGWDPVDLWSLDLTIAEDVLAVLRVIQNARAYPNELGFKAEIERVWKLWRGDRPRRERGRTWRGRT